MFNFLYHDNYLVLDTYNTLKYDKILIATIFIFITTNVTFRHKLNLNCDLKLFLATWLIVYLDQTM